MKPGNRPSWARHGSWRNKQQEQHYIMIKTNHKIFWNQTNNIYVMTKNHLPQYDFMMYLLIYNILLTTYRYWVRFSKLHNTPADQMIIINNSSIKDMLFWYINVCYSKCLCPGNCSKIYYSFLSFIFITAIRRNFFEEVYSYYIIGFYACSSTVKSRSINKMHRFSSGVDIGRYGHRNM